MKNFKRALIIALILVPVSLLFAGCFSLKYNVNVDSNLTNISIGVSKSKADPDDEIVLSYNNLNQDYVFNYYTVDGKKIEGNTFKMPKKDVVVSASISRIRFYISYVLQEGETTGSKASYKESDGVFNLSDATKTGYIFNGWYETPNFSGERITQINAAEKRDYRLYPKFISAEVSEDGYRMISSPSDFIDIISTLPGGNYRLKNDIDFEGYLYKSICNETAFFGELDGNGKSLKNINFIENYESANTGLFGKTNNAKIYNLNIENVKAVEESCIQYGTVVVNANNTEFTNISISCSEIRVDRGVTTAGLLAAHVEQSEINECSVKTNSIRIVSDSTVRFGLIAGSIDNVSINKSFAELNADVNITTNHLKIYFGGLVGEDAGYSVISDCYFVQSTLSKVYLTNTFEDDGANGITVGGLVGHAKYNSRIGDSYAALSSFELIVTNVNENTLRRFGGLVGSETEAGQVRNSFVIANKQNGNTSIRINLIESIGYICSNASEGYIDRCYFDSQTMFIGGLAIMNNPHDKDNVELDTLENIKEKTAWSNTIWDLESNIVLPSLK